MLPWMFGVAFTARDATWNNQPGALLRLLRLLTALASLTAVPAVTTLHDSRTLVTSNSRSQLHAQKSVYGARRTSAGLTSQRTTPISNRQHPPRGASDH